MDFPSFATTGELDAQTGPASSHTRGSGRGVSREPIRARHPCPKAHGVGELPRAMAILGGAAVRRGLLDGAKSALSGAWGRPAESENGSSVNFDPR